MLGQPVSMIIPEVVGFHLTGALKEGITATDLVLTVTQMLRAKGVVGRFVEFFGPGVSALSVADRATIANMAPEYGATCGFFPVDHKTLEYMRLTGRPEADDRADRGLLPRAGHVARGGRRRSGLHRDAAARHVDASSPASPAPSGRRTRSCSPRWTRSSGPISPPNIGHPDRRAARALRRRRAQCRRREARYRPWRRRDRRDHLVHQHLQPLGAGRRRPGRAQGAGAGARFQALGEDQPGAGLAGGHRLSRPRRASPRTSTRSASIWSAMAAPPASAIRGRCPRRSAPRSTRMTWSPPRSSPATAISKAASRPTCAPIISPRRRSSSLMRSRAR